jgi:hypothetical protein
MGGGAGGRDPSGQRLIVRPVRVTDEEALQDLLYRLSDEHSLAFHAVRQPSARRDAGVGQLDYNRTWPCSGDPETPAQEIIAIARYDVNPAAIWPTSLRGARRLAAHGIGFF